MLALPPGGTIAVGDWGRRDDRSDALASRSLTNPQVWTEVTHVTVSSTPVERFDGTMDTLMDHEVPVWTTKSLMIDAGRPCTNRGRRQSLALLPPHARHAAVQPPQPCALASHTRSCTSAWPSPCTTPP